MNQFLTVLLGFVLVLQFSSRALAQEEGQPLLPLMPGRLYPNLLNDENRDRLTNSESMKQRAQYNLEVWESHRFPWLPLISLATLGLGLFFVRYVRSHRVQPVETEAERKNVCSKKRCK